MSERQNLEHILGQAKEQEKRYEWLGAVDFHKKALSSALGSQDFLRAGEIVSRIGFCYRRAAFQAENSEIFKERIHLAVESYNQASELFDKAEVAQKEKLAKSTYCKAFSVYANFKLTADLSRKKTLLDECIGMLKEALNAYEEAKDRIGYGKTCNEFLERLEDRISLERDWQKQKIMVWEALNYGEKAIIMLSNAGDDWELARAYLRTSYAYNYAGWFNERKEKWKELVEKGLGYAQKASELSEKVGDAYLICWSIFGLVNSASSLSDFYKLAIYGGKLIQQSAKLKDNEVLGWVSLGMTQIMEMMMTVEENPDKMREGYGKTVQFAEEALPHFNIISDHYSATYACNLITESYIHLAREVETRIEQKSVLLQKAVRSGQKGLEHAEQSGSARNISTSLHVLSKALYFLSTMEKNLEEKRRLLEEASKLRERSISLEEQTKAPFDYWSRGTNQNYLALIRTEQAEIEIDRDKKRESLENAVSVMENCLKLCKKALIERPQMKVVDVPFSLIPFGWYQGWFGGILEKLYSLTGDERILEKAIEAYKGVVETYGKVGFSSRVAEAHWKIAKFYNRLGSYQESAGHFESASKHYETSAEGMPNLKEFYIDYASYMRAWAEIERARFSSAKEEYDQARKHYEKAASLFESTKAWKYLAPNYSALALLEQAEDQSRKNQNQEAIETFKKAAQLFDKAKDSLGAQATKTQSPEEKDMVLAAVKASQIRSEYCRGKMALEEGKTLDKEGNHLPSSQKYMAAARIFEKLNKETESEIERKELKPIVYLCLAWQKMTLADARASPELYAEASKLFEEASEHSRSERAGLLALGHSRFCKALEAGTRFTDTRDTALHSVTMQHLQSAMSYYQRSGLQDVAEYARATGLLFDAYVHMDNAKKETDPEKKARLYMMTEKILQASAGAYLKAKHLTKMEEVQRLLTRVKEERELAVSLTEILLASPIVSTTPAFSTPIMNEERAVGLERFEHATIEAKPIFSSKEAKLGEEVNLEIQIMNVGKEAAQLVKVEEILPQGFELVAEPDYFHFEDAHLDMKGKRLDPLKTQEIRLVFRPFEKGTFTIKPKIIYLDETGKHKTCKPEPVTLAVLQVILPNRITTGYGDLDNLLFGGIPENLAVILTSPSCDEKDLIIRKFLEAGAKTGQITYYVTTEASGIKPIVEEFQSNFYLFICNPQADKIIKSLPNVFKLKGVENLTDISIALTSAFRKLDVSLRGPRRACIEIVSDVLLQHRAVKTRRWLTGLIPELRSRGFTTLAVTNPQMHPSEEVQAILDLFEGEINIYEKETQKGLQKFLKIKKMYNQRYLENELPLRKERLA